MHCDIKGVEGHSGRAFLIYYIDYSQKCESALLRVAASLSASFTFVSTVTEGRAFTANADNQTIFDYSQQVLHEDPG